MEERALLFEQAKKRRSKAIYPALVLALNCGLRDKEICRVQWGRFHLDQAYLVVGHTKSDAGSGRTVPLNKNVLAAMKSYVVWYEENFGAPQPDWFVFPFGKPQPIDPTRPCTRYVGVCGWSLAHLRRSLAAVAYPLGIANAKHRGRSAVVVIMNSAVRRRTFAIPGDSAADGFD
jgi:integrase